jgi:dimethylaniline monooxygenase (N-oxide forming)
MLTVTDRVGAIRVNQTGTDSGSGFPAVLHLALARPAGYNSRGDRVECDAGAGDHGSDGWNGGALVRLGVGARVAVIGAGPGGLVAAKHAIEAGFEVSVFEASDDLGGQWNTAAAHSGIWAGMRTNTSRAMTAFSDYAPPFTHELHPFAEQIHDYLRSYSAASGVTDRIRFATRVRDLQPPWLLDGEPFDAVIVASGRFRAPVLPGVLEGFTGEVLHAFDYPGVDYFRGRRVLVYGNGVSGHEIASDLAAVTTVISAYRKARYVLQKNVAGVSSDWQWYTHIGALRRAVMPPPSYGALLRDRVLRVAGNPADFGAPEPSADFLVAGHSLCQDYLTQVRAGTILCRPAIVRASGNEVTFADGSCERVDAIIAATGYRLEIPYLSRDLWSILGPDLRLHHRTLHPDLSGFGVVGQFALQGPYFPLLELQARWIVNSWSGAGPEPDARRARASMATAPPPIDSHNVLALTLADAAGVAPDMRARPDLAEPLLFGPMLPARYRLDGPGAHRDAAATFREQLAASPRAAVEADDIAALPDVGYGDLLPTITSGSTIPPNANRRTPTGQP